MNFNKTVPIAILALSALSVSCSKDGGGGFWKSGDDTSTSTTETSAPCDSSDTGCDTAETGTTETGDTPLELAFDDPGDYFIMAETDEYVDIADYSGESNRDQEFYVVFVNTSEEDQGVRLNYAPYTASSLAPPAPALTSSSAGRTLPAVRESFERNWTPKDPPPPLDSSSIGTEADEFFVRNDVNDPESFAVVDATLWGLGEYVAMWVDDDVAIDWDYECDGVIDEPSSRPAYGFDNCDLQTVADIVDSNIVINFRSLFGEESDINGDGRISVIISPVLNAVALTSVDEDEHDRVVGSYADPKTDLNSFDGSSNPGSDEQELIYVFAPDPHGFYNPYNTTTVDEYTSQELVGQIALSYLQLISYNQHIIVNESEPEESWLTMALGFVGADIVGFGAVFYRDAWEYLDAPYLYPLTPDDEDSDCGFFCGTNVGAQYLFGRWLVDKYGEDILETISTSTLVGGENVESAAGENFEDLVLAWQVAMLTTGVLTETGAALVDTGAWTPFHAASTISAPTEPPAVPTVGIYYGANGHQTGFNVRGVNKFIEGGATDSPYENISRRVRAEGSDFHTYTPGFPFYGFIAGGYGGFAARMTTIPYDATRLELEGTEGSLKGVVIRWHDEDAGNLAEEDIYSAMDANSVALPPLPDDGSEVHGVGEISAPGTTILVDIEGGTESTLVEDVDRWLLDLTDRDPSEIIQVAVWLERRFENTEGDVAPFDPWIAIAPEAAVPTPEVGVTQFDSTCGGSTSWLFPQSMYEYVYTQEVLQYVAFTDGDSEFDACGERSEEALTCSEDWDEDLVPDSEEPMPASFVQQIMVRQCSNEGGTMPQSVYSSDYVDIDESDEDEDSSYSAVYNVGGKSGEDGEEALLYSVLEGGERYIIVVSGGGDTGIYELHLRQLN